MFATMLTGPRINAGVLTLFMWFIFNLQRRKIVQNCTTAEFLTWGGGH
jgi:hypothetical protein